MGDATSGPIQLSFNPQLRVEFRGATATSDAGLLLPRELDERLGLNLTESGYASPQIDVLILSPAYPRLGVDQPFDRAFDGRQGLDGFAGTALRKP
jgi:hypothetical protein